MSKTKFVEYTIHGFWAYDVALHIFLKHLIDAAEASDEARTQWLSSAISSWRTACVPDHGLTLDAGWSAAERQTFVSLTADACAQLAMRTSIPAEEIVSWPPILDDLRIFARNETEVLTAPVVELGYAIIGLVSGELTEAPPGKFWVYGTPTGRQTIGRQNA